MVVVILSLLPDATGASSCGWANLTLTQIYAADPDRRPDPDAEPVRTLFYAAPPVLALLGRRIPVGARAPAIAALAALSWAWLALLDAGQGSTR